MNTQVLDHVQSASFLLFVREIQVHFLIRHVCLGVGIIDPGTLPPCSVFAIPRACSRSRVNCHDDESSKSHNNFYVQDFGHKPLEKRKIDRKSSKASASRAVMMKPETQETPNRKTYHRQIRTMVILASSDHFYGIYGALSSDGQLKESPAFSYFLLTVQLEI